MTILVGLEKILDHNVVEDSRIEFKEGWNPEPIMHTICAFSNDIGNLGGGYIVIGMEDRGKPIGIDPSSADILNRSLFDIINRVNPACRVETQLMEYQGKEVFVIWVPAGRDKPYDCPRSLSKKSDKREVYVRKLSSNAVATTQEVRELISNKIAVPFDDWPNKEATIEDIDRGLIDDYLKRVNPKMYKVLSGMDTDEILSRLHLVDKVFEQTCYRNAALLFFTQEPERFFENAVIELTYKPDPTGKEMVEKVCRGPLDSQIMQAVEFVNRYAVEQRTIKLEDTPVAKKIYSYPPDAVEEAIVNAVLHKDYSVRLPISLVIESDRIWIRSHPGPFSDITDQDLQDGIMVSDKVRNAHIANILKELGLAEARNTGIPLIHQSIILNGSDLPRLETDAERSYFKIVLPIHRSFMTQKEECGNGRGRTQGEIRSEVLRLLAENGEMSVKDISDSMGYRMPSSNLRAAIQVLISSRAIEYTDESRNSPMQKLRLRI
jgi:ATP-dependent DNA helicase RecG